MHVSDTQRRRRLADRQLGRHDGSALAVADRLVALHASDPATVYLSVSARSPGTSIQDVERELYAAPSLIRHHAMRRTLWVMSAAVTSAAHAACTRKIAAAERTRTARLFGRDVAWLDDSVDRVVDVVATADDPISTKEIGERLPDLAERITVAEGTSYEGTLAIHTRVLLQAAFEARIVRTRPAGTWIGTQYAWTTPDRWIDVEWDAHDVNAGQAELVRRWLRAFGPGTLDDIVWWTGSTKTTVRQAIDRIGAVDVELDAGSGFLLHDDDGSIDDPGPQVALLPGLDPTPMGWKVRDWYLPPEVAERVVDRNGNIGPTVWVDGRIVGGWVQRPDGSIAHDAEVPRARRPLLDAEIDRVTAFVGDTRFRVRFPSPNQRRLLA